jgi:hypothetical protein
MRAWWRAGGEDRAMTNARSAIDELAGEFSDLPRETIVRQYVDALSSVELFAVSGEDEPELVARLVRSHLEALSQLRAGSEEQDPSPGPV